MTIQLPQLGDLFEGRYAIREVLGQGGFATVYRATDRTVAREVVLKVLSPRDGGYPRTVKARFQREARVFAELHDPHTITMFDFGESREGLLYMVFEFVAGRDLGEVLAEHGRLPPRVVVHILTQLLSALREAHDLGVLHRDLKPANVLVYAYDGDPYRVKLIDFGIAKDIGPDAANITRTGHVVGTVRYMSPEQLLGAPVGPPSDLYSLGLLAFELLTGRPAIAGESQKELLKQQVSDVPLRVPPAVAGEQLRNTIDRLMARDPAARYQSAADALRDARAARSEAATWVQEVAPPIADPRPSNRPAPPVHSRDTPIPPPESAASRRAAAVVFGLALTAAIAVGVVWAVTTRPDEPPPPRFVTLPMSAPPEPTPAAEPAPRDADHLADSGTPHVPDGCGARPPFTGTGTMTADLLGRPWHMYIPPTYDPNVRHPLLLMFHRKFGDGASLLEASLISQSADERGFIILSFTSSSSTDWPVAEETDAVTTALDIVREKLCIDPTRLYAFGDETGSSFVRELSCVLPMSAVAVTATTTGKVCNSPDPAPRLRIYGTHDVYIRPDGENSCAQFAGGFASAASIDRDWKRVHRCNDTQTTWGEFRGGRCRTWSCAASPYVVCETDSGEVWPHEEPIFGRAVCGVRKPKVRFPYRDAIWTFFEQEGRTLPSRQPHIP